MVVVRRSPGPSPCPSPTEPAGDDNLLKKTAVAQQGLNLAPDERSQGLKELVGESSLLISLACGTAARPQTGPAGGLRLERLC